MFYRPGTSLTRVWGLPTFGLRPNGSTFILLLPESQIDHPSHGFWCSANGAFSLWNNIVYETKQRSVNYLVSTQTVKWIKCAGWDLYKSIVMVQLDTVLSFLLVLMAYLLRFSPQFSVFESNLCFSWVTSNDSLCH